MRWTENPEIIVRINSVPLISIAMSRSKRKPIYKDRGWEHDIYNKRTRRVQKQKIKDIINLRDIESYNIPLERELVNDYDISDYRLDYRFDKGKKDKFYLKLLRK